MSPAAGKPKTARTAVKATAGAAAAAVATGTADRGYIDVNALIGPAHGRAGGATPAQLTAERTSHGVRFSLVRSRNALLGETRLGNQEMLEACERDPALIPVAVLLPERTDGLELARALARKVKAFWLEGRATPGRGSAAGDQLVRAAARTGRPIFVQIAAWGDASAVGAATADLGVPVILVGTHYDNSVDTLAAARRYPHLHLDTSRMAHLGAIELAVREIGAERVLLGTSAPLRAIQSSLNAIAMARIPDAAKRAILGGNAARLLGLPAGKIEIPVVEMPERAIDVHTHGGPLPWDVADLPDDELMPELARQNNTRFAVASSILAIAADSEAGNRRTVEGCKAMPNRLGYLVADPNDLPATRDQIRRWGDAPGIVGAKVHCQWSGQTDRFAADLGALQGPGRLRQAGEDPQ